MGLARYAPLPRASEWLRVKGRVDGIRDKSIAYLIPNGNAYDRLVFIPLSQLEVRAVKEGDKDIVVKAWLVEKNGWPSLPVSALA